MFGKRTRYLTMLAAALGIPYAWFNENFSGPVRSTWSSLQQTVSKLGGNRAGEAETLGSWIHTISTAMPVVHAASAPTASMHQLVEVLRFDITPRWVLDHWSRVSTVHAEQNLEGLRVPLVTGTNVHDIAGSLTYYFDAQQRVRRIRLHGQTGDERMLVGIGTKHFGLRQEPSMSAGIYINRWNATPMNVLRITHSPIVRANAPNTRLNVELELNDLRAGYGLSAEFAQQLQPELSSQPLQRWGT